MEGNILQAGNPLWQHFDQPRIYSHDTTTYPKYKPKRSFNNVFLHNSRKVCIFVADFAMESGESPEQSRCCNLCYCRFP